MVQLAGQKVPPHLALLTLLNFCLVATLLHTYTTLDDLDLAQRSILGNVARLLNRSDLAPPARSQYGSTASGDSGSDVSMELYQTDVPRPRRKLQAEFENQSAGPSPTPSKASNTLECKADCRIEADGDASRVRPALDVDHAAQRSFSDLATDVLEVVRGGARSLKHAVMSHTSVTSATTLSKTSPTVIFCNTASGAVTVTLPAAATMAETAQTVRYYTVVNTGSSTCTVATSSSQAIYTNRMTTTWHDGSTYDTLHGGSTATATTAAFTPTSTISPYYVHTAQTLTVTSAYDNDAQTCCSTPVIASISTSPVTVATGTTSSSTPVLNGISTPKRDVVGTVSISPTSVLNGVSAPASTSVVGITRHSTLGQSVSYTNDQWATCTSYYVRYNPTSSHCSQGTYHPYTFAYTYNDVQVISWPNWGYNTDNAVTTINTNSKTVVQSVSGPAATEVIYEANPSAVSVLSNAGVGNTVAAVHYPSFSSPAVNVLSSLPSISSHATMTQANIVQTVTGNVAVSHNKDVRSSTVVYGTISVSDASSASSATSIVLQSGSSITLISDGSSAWYQIGGRHGQVTQ